jgi:ABC-type Fe3+-hydroxamate transport system substrate-binding protein
MLRLEDDMGRDVMLARPPRRVVSLVPSDTDSIFALGAGDRLVGRTRYCVEPAAAAEVPEVGGTKDVDVDAVVELAPDLVIANQEENARAPLEALVARGVPLFVSFPRRVAEGLGHIARLARLLGIEREPMARELIRAAYQLGETLAPAPADAPRAFVPVWNDPLMTFDDDTFAGDLLACAGLANAFGDRQRNYPLAADLGRRSPLAADRLAARDRRYPRLAESELIERAPDVVLLPDEPHAFGPDDVARFSALDLPAGKNGAVRLVDGKDLFWYGAHTLTGLPRLRALVAELGATRGPSAGQA